MVVYYLGKNSFTSKAGNQCFTVDLLVYDGKSAFGAGRQGSTKCFVDSVVFESLTGIAVGQAVRVDSVGGTVYGVYLDRDHEPLLFGVKSE